MMVRRYIVREMPEAVVQIRRELGKDAVILSTRRVTLKKWLGLWRNHRIEVVAAVGDDVPLNTAATIAKRAQTVGKDHQHPASHDTSPLQSDAVTTLHNTEQPENQVGLEALRQELAAVKQLIEQSVISTTQVASGPEAVEAGVRLIDALVTRGFSRPHAAAIVREAHDIPKADKNMEDLLAAVIRERLITRKVYDASPLSSTSKIVALVGPTGVGKTTTIAKLAALHVLAGRKVGFITLDTYRIAAIDQLRTFANILNVPIEIVYQLDDIAAARSKLSNCDIVFVDTPGRNYNNSESVTQVKSYLERLEVDEVILVLSATCRIEDLHRLTEQFQNVQIDKFLFTKLDETESHGAILELMYSCEKPLSFVTNGQNVPDDIEIPSIENIVNGILGGAVYGGSSRTAQTAHESAQ